MAFYETTWWMVAFNVVWPLFVVNFLIDTLRSMALPGTHRRYVYASIEWTIFWTGPALWLMYGVSSIAQGNSMWVFDTCIFLIETRRAYLFVTARDDNWFNQTGKRVKKWARDRVGSLTPMPHGAGA